MRSQKRKDEGILNFRIFFSYHNDGELRENVDSLCNTGDTKYILLYSNKFLTTISVLSLFYL